MNIMYSTFICILQYGNAEHFTVKGVTGIYYTKYNQRQWRMIPSRAQQATTKLLFVIGCDLPHKLQNSNEPHIQMQLKKRMTV